MKFFDQGLGKFGEKWNFWPSFWKVGGKWNFWPRSWKFEGNGIFDQCLGRFRNYRIMFNIKITCWRRIWEGKKMGGQTMDWCKQQHLFNFKPECSKCDIFSGTICSKSPVLSSTCVCAHTHTFSCTHTHMHTHTLMHTLSHAHTHTVSHAQSKTQQQDMIYSL